jgi:triosephosphate isomerase
MYTQKKIRTPFFSVNPKSYIYGKEALDLAIAADALAVEFEVDMFFTAQLVDLPAIAKACPHLIVSAQHMDPVVPGRGMGAVLPEALVAAGVKAVTLNHAEKPMSLFDLSKAIARADEVGLITFVCANSLTDAKAIAMMAPNIIVCEQTSLIGTGIVANEGYMDETTAAIKALNSDILVVQAAGIHCQQDVYKVISKGSDGTGATSGIMEAPDRVLRIREMLQGLAKARAERAAS